MYLIQLETSELCMGSFNFLLFFVYLHMLESFHKMLQVSQESLHFIMIYCSFQNCPNGYIYHSKVIILPVYSHVETILQQSLFYLRNGIYGTFVLQI